MIFVTLEDEDELEDDDGEPFEDEWCQACNHCIDEDDPPCPIHGEES